jgi:hypothetical protein
VIAPVRACRVLVLALAVLVVGCTGSRSNDREFAGDGRIRANLVIGHHQFEGSEWVDVVSTTGPTDERCDLSDCGLSVDARRAGTFWPPGDWIVVAPTVKGWLEPLPLEITVGRGQVTDFTLTYRRAEPKQRPWAEGSFAHPEFPIGLGLVFKNGWSQIIDGEYVLVFAGARAKPETVEPTRQGVILVQVINPQSWGHTFFFVESPIPGPVKIVNVDGHRLTVVSPSRETAIFDADARRFL